MSQDDKLTLEQMVDRTNVEAIVRTLSHICSDKEQHILSNWGDQELAKQWRKAELQLDKLANSLPYGLRSAK